MIMLVMLHLVLFKQKTAYEMRISDWSSDVCSSDLVSVLWMTTFGGTAIDQATLQGLSGVKDAVLELKLFAMLEGLPLKEITSLLGIVLVIVFFITSSDSGSLVIDTITAGGRSEEHTSELQSLMRISYDVFCLNQKNTAYDYHLHYLL